MIRLLSILLLSATLGATPAAVLPMHPYLGRMSSIDITVNGAPGTYLFDTGEGVTAISPAVAAQINCHPWGRVTGFRMTGERGGNPHCDNLVIGAAGQSLQVPSAILLDLMKLLGPTAPHVDGSVGLDAFARQAITIVPSSCIVIESKESLRERIANGKQLPIRLVRDAEGLALSVDAAVPTRDGIAWMELDSGNGGTLVIANHIAPLLGLPTDQSTPQQTSFQLANGITVSGLARSRDLIMDGNIGSRFLSNWNLTLDLANGTAWLEPKTPCPHT